MKWSDRFYGWGLLMSGINPAPMRLQGGHYDVFTGEKNLTLIGSVVGTLLSKSKDDGSTLDAPSRDSHLQFS